MAKYGIGQAITRREDQRLLTGTGKYVDDLVLPGQVFAAFVRSPHPRARIIEMPVRWEDSPGSKVQLVEGLKNTVRDLWRIRRLHRRRPVIAA